MRKNTDFGQLWSSISRDTKYVETFYLRNIISTTSLQGLQTPKILIYLERKKCSFEGSSKTQKIQMHEISKFTKYRDKQFVVM